MEVEVRVHSVRRRRSDPAPDKGRPPNVRNWLIYAGLGALMAGLMFEGYLSHRPRNATLPLMAEATGVRSTISPATPDSLQVVVAWDLTLSTPEGQPDSVRVKVVAVPGSDSVISMQVASAFADTALVLAPAAGQTLTGSSCVTARHLDKPSTESCTPWQYVRPAATAQAGGVVAQKVVVEPRGLQVDPDVDGRCAEWQRTHPGQPVWVVVNRVAIPACTGANGKPTVAQFCAFVVLADGRRMKSANSANNRYCDELFEEWTRERYS